MRILYISQYYPPEIGAPSARVSEMAQHWAALGHSVTVLTGFPNHPTGKLHPDYRSHWRGIVAREDDHGVNVVRTWLWPRPNRGVLDRVVNYASFMLSAMLTGMTLAEPDAVIATSPQLLVGISGWWLSRMLGSAFYFEVRDLWPESIAAVRYGARKSLIYRVLESISAFLYRKADEIVVVSPAFRQRLEDDWNVETEKIHVVENGVDLSRFSNAEDNAAKKAQIGAQNKFVAIYMGTIGTAFGFDTFLHAAARLAESHPNVCLLLIGEGEMKKRLTSEVAARGLQNVVLRDGVDREEVTPWLAAADAGLVLLRDAEVFRTVIPTKMLEYMAAGLPVVSNVEGQAQAIVNKAKAGVCVAASDGAALADAIANLAADSVRRAEFGANGRSYVAAHLTRRKKAEEFMELLEAGQAQIAAMRRG